MSGHLADDIMTTATCSLHLGFLQNAFYCQNLRITSVLCAGRITHQRNPMWIESGGYVQCFKFTSFSEKLQF